MLLNGNCGVVDNIPAGLELGEVELMTKEVMNLKLKPLVPLTTNKLCY